MKITWLVNEPRYFFFLKASKLVVGLTKGFIRGKALSVEGHTHDDRYFTESEMNTKLNNKFNYDSSRDTNTDMNTLISQGITGIMYTEGTNQTNLHTPLGEATSGYSTISYYNVETLSYSSGGRLCQIALSCLSHNPGMWYRIKHDANWRKWNKVSIDGHTHSASNITSGTLPVARGGTGVTTLNALKTLLGIDTSENSITKIVSGTYKGTATNKYDNATIQVITVSGINKIKFLIVSAMSSPPVLADSFGTDVITTWVYSLFGFASNTVSNNSSLVISSDNTFTVGSQDYNTSSHHSRLNIAQYMYMYFAFGT